MIIYICICSHYAEIKYNFALVFFAFSREIPILFLDIWSSQLEKLRHPTISQHGDLQSKMFHSALIYMYTFRGPANQGLMG